MNRLARTLLSRNLRLSTSTTTRASAVWAKSLSFNPHPKVNGFPPLQSQFRFKRYVTSSRPLLSPPATSSTSPTSSPPATTSTIEVAETQNEDFLRPDPQKESKGLFGEWPLYPLVGLGLISAISKEILILNDEIIYVAAFSTAALTAYIYIGETLRKFLQDKVDAQNENFVEAAGYAADYLKKHLIIAKRQLSYPDDVRSLQEEEKTMSAITLEYRNKKHKMDVNEATLQKLSTIRAIEAEEAKAYKTAMTDYALAYLNEKLSKLTPDERSQILDHIIEQIPTNRGTAVYEDLITRYIDEFLSYGYTPADFGVVSRVPAFMSTKKEASGKH